jgi:hypothetical protein
MNQHIKSAKLEDVGSVEKETPMFDLPVRLAPLHFDEGGGYYEIPIVDARANAICFVPCPDGSEASEAWRTANARAEFVRNAINGKQQG